MLDPLVYRPKDAARLLGICRASVFIEIKAGRLPSHKYGARRLIRAEDILKWLNDSRLTETHVRGRRGQMSK